MDRNTKQAIKKDIEFLAEMEETADKAMNFTGKYSGQSDLSSASHLMTLIKDWKQELLKVYKGKIGQNGL